MGIMGMPGNRTLQRTYMHVDELTCNECTYMYADITLQNNAYKCACTCTMYMYI